MLTDMPMYVYTTFAIAILFSLVMFYYASNKSVKFIIAIVSWGVLHSILSVSGFYDNTQTMPPRFLLVGVGMMGIVLATVFSKKTKDWLSTFNLKQLTLLHTVRIPVELVLYWLFIGGYAPELISFEGLNFDVIIGLTAPIIALIAFRKNQINRPLLMIWNVCSFILVTNIIFLTIFSTPSVIQQFSFEQPHIAVTKFPFVLLPTIIVPIVLMSIMAAFVILKRKD